MADTSYEFLTSFFQDHLPFTPTASQIATFQTDLSLVSPFLMEAALKEVKAGSKGAALQLAPNEWRPAIFGVYNRKVAEHAQLFPIFHSFETAFRSTVAVALERHYGQARWWQRVYLSLQRGIPLSSVTQIGTVTITNKIAKLIRTIILAIDGDQLRRNLTPNFANGFQLVECCDLVHIRELIEAHWGIFSPLFIGRSPPLTQSDFKAKFDRVRDARNDVYHHKSLARMSNVVATAEELLDYLNFSLEFVFKKITSCNLTAPTFSVSLDQRHRTW